MRSGSIEPRELARNRLFSTVFGTGRYICGIYARIYAPICMFRCPAGSKRLKGGSVKLFGVERRKPCRVALVLYSGARGRTDSGKKEGTDGQAGSPRRAPLSGVVVSFDALNRDERHVRRSTRRFPRSTRRPGIDQAVFAEETDWPFRAALCVADCRGYQSS
jgi:hypothetical protein